VTVVGDGYPSVVVDFGRDAALSPAALAGGALWSAGTAFPLKDLRDWALLVLNKEGVWPVDVCMAVNTFDAFINNVNVSAKWNSVNEKMQGTLVAGQELVEGGVYMGSIEGFNIFVYAGWYIDDADAEQQILPNSWLFMASPALEGVQAYGAIKDHDSLAAVPYFPKSWTQPDPSVRFLMLQSAPLVVPTRPNATFGRQVIA
jgi:hypothetical protein